ncbi:MAG: BNR-4 repeat-containing protein [Armatimonadota bacterium]
MKRNLSILLILTCLLIATAALGASLPLGVRGAKNMVIQAEPGPLSVTIIKQDLNIYEGPDIITGRFLDPLGRELEVFEIPDGEKEKGRGPRQTLTLQTEAKVSGLYRVEMSGSSDLIIGMETNAAHYAVMGGISFHLHQASGRVYFLPPDEEKVEIAASAAHHPGKQDMPLVDASGETIHTFSLGEPREEFTFTIEPDMGDRSAPWYLDIEKLDVNIKFSNIRYWAMEEGALFVPEEKPYHLGPWKHVQYLQPGEEAEKIFFVYNHSDETVNFSTGIESPDGLVANVEQRGVTVEPDGSATIPVTFSVGDDAPIDETLTAELIVTKADEPGVGMTSDLEVRVGESPVSKPLDLPIVHRKFTHENELFGYAPEYRCGPVYFDHQNRAHMLSPYAMWVMEDGQWARREFTDELAETFDSYAGTDFTKHMKIAFDENDGAWFTVRMRRDGHPTRTLLMYTPDHGRTYIPVPEMPSGKVDFEQFTGHNDYPIPRIVHYETRQAHPAKWTSYQIMRFYMPTVVDGKPDIGEPFIVSEDATGGSQHSGGPATMQTKDGQTSFVWIEPTPPEDEAPGMPTFVGAYNHGTGEMGERLFLRYGYPPNDGHNQPALCLDSEGYLHALTGAHGDNFYYLRSQQPNDPYGGWTEPEKTLTAGWVDADTDEDGRGRQTYASLICDPDDTLHIAFRQWRNIGDYHKGSYYGGLSYQQKPKDGSWSPAKVIVVPPVSGYSIYYHKLTVDRQGWLWLFYRYYSGDEEYRYNYLAYNQKRAVLVSRDGGDTWKLAETEDFAEAEF